MDVDFKAIGLIFWKHLIIHSSEQWPEDKPKPIQSPVPEFGSSATPVYVYVVVYSALDFLGWPIPPQPWHLRHCIPSDVPRRVWLRTILSGHSPRPFPSCYVWCFVFCQLWKGGLNLRPRQRSPCSFMHMRPRQVKSTTRGSPTDHTPSGGDFMEERVDLLMEAGLLPLSAQLLLSNWGEYAAWSMSSGIARALRRDARVEAATVTLAIAAASLLIFCCAK